MFDFLTNLFRKSEQRKTTRFVFPEDKMFKSIKVKLLTYNLIKDYAQRHNRSMATVVYIAMNHLLLLEKNYAKDINESN